MSGLAKFELSRRSAVRFAGLSLCGLFGVVVAAIGLATRQWGLVASATPFVTTPFVLYSIDKDKRVRSTDVLIGDL